MIEADIDLEIFWRNRRRVLRGWLWRCEAFELASRDTREAKRARRRLEIHLAADPFERPKPLTD